MAVATKDERDKQYIEWAFDLAYFIHANKGIALCLAEAAWHKLEPALLKQDKRRYYRLVGRKLGRDRSRRASRTKIWLSEEHMLQCLVYAESDAWERCTEHGDSPYPLTEEDMIIRFIKHLVRIAMRRNSFYVTLGVSQLLYEYGTSEVTRLYGILSQDPNLSKDKPYVRQQRKVLIRELIERFSGQIQPVTTSEKGECFVSQPTTPRLLNLVNECLRRFTP